MSSIKIMHSIMFETRPNVEARDTLSPALEKLADEAVDFTRTEDETHGALAGIVRQNFDGQGTFAGGWPSLSPGYAQRKQKLYGDKPILQASGALVDSLTRRDAPGAVFRVSRDEVNYGSALPHARAHQRGVPSRNLPARPVIPSPEVFAAAVLRVQRGDAIKLAKGLGFGVET
jgi:hypothetical protein